MQELDHDSFHANEFAFAKELIEKRSAPEAQDFIAWAIAHARKTKYGYMLSVNSGICLQVIQCAAQSPGPGGYRAEIVSAIFQLEDSIKGFKMIVNGELDELPEQAFYMRGTIEEAIEAGEKLTAGVA